MENDKIAEKWFKQTFEKVQEEVHPVTGNDLLIVGVLFAARKYTRAVLLLLSQKHALPAKALLRILCELFVKIVWCLDSQSNEEDTEERIHKSFQSWDYSRLIQDKKLLANLEKYVEGDFGDKVQDALKKAANDIADYKERPVKCIPPTAEIFKELSIREPAMNNIYAEIYQNYSRAVHLDRNTFSRLVQYKGDKILCYDDLDDDINDLYIKCLCLACDINIVIRKHYNWPTDMLRKEWLKLTPNHDN